MGHASHSRGFAITLDAIAALSFMLMALYFIESTSFNPMALKGTELKQISLDTMAVLQKSGRLDAVLLPNYNGTSVKEVIAATPSQVCMDMTVMAINGTMVASISKPGCGAAVTQSQTVYGIFSYGGTVFTTTLKSWYNEGVPG